MAAQKRVRLTTPKGIAKFPWLNRPDTRFNSDGVYTVSLLLTPEEAQPLMEQLDELADQAVEKAKQDLVEKGKKTHAKKVVRMEPYKMEEDAEGTETGMVEFKFKMKAKITKKDNTVIELFPKLFDSKGKPINAEETQVFGGSIIKVNYTPSPYYVASTKGAGVSLQLNAVQVIELISRGGDASFFGFDVEEDGFDAEEVSINTNEDFVNEDAVDEEDF